MTIFMNKFTIVFMIDWNLDEKSLIMWQQLLQHCNLIIAHWRFYKEWIKNAIILACSFGDITQATYI